SNFPQALAVNSVTITSPTNSFNTLLLNFAGTGSPLVIGVDSNTPGSLVIGDSNSAVVLFSSGLTVNNALGTNNSHLGEFEVDGTFNESEGSQVTAGFLEVGGSGTYSITNSLLSAPGEFIFGHFNQQGGTNVGAVIRSSLLVEVPENEFAWRREQTVGDTVSAGSADLQKSGRHLGTLAFIEGAVHLEFA